MKHTTYLSLLAVAALASLASCSSEDTPDAPAAGDVETFTISMPAQLGSRAFDTGLKATNLYVAVYPQGSTDAAIISNFKDGANSSAITTNGFNGSSLSTTVTIPLVKGSAYDVIFWAESYEDGAEGNPYTFDSAARTITVDYDNMPIDAEQADAFYAQVAITSDGSSHNVTLTRPFAQFNVGTNDLSKAAAAGKPVTKAGLTFSELDTTFNLATSSTSGSTTNVNFATQLLPSSTDFPFPVAGYDYLAMAYVLVGTGTSDKVVIPDVALTLNDDTTPFATYTNIPAERNYRTNIYGSLLTDSEKFSVTINPAFSGDYQENIVTVASPEEFVEALANANDGDVIRPTSNMSLASSGNLTVNNNITIDVPDGITVTTARTNNAANIIVAQDKTLHLTGKGTFSADNRIIDVNGTLNVDGPTFTTGTVYQGSAISVNPGGNLNFNSGTINAAYAGVWVNGNATINGGTINLTSTNKNKDPQGNSTWIYGVRADGENAKIVINDGTFTGIQGIVAAIDKSTVEINGGFFRTYNSSASDKDGFYCVYSTDQSKVYIKGGYFYGANEWNAIADGLSCIVSGDNDVNSPLGSIQVSGGYFSGKPYYLESPNPVVAPVTGTYVPCSVVKDGYTFTWTVKQ